MACLQTDPVLEIVEYLLQCGAEPNALHGDQGMTVLHLLLTQDPCTDLLALLGNASQIVPFLSLTLHL